MSLLLALMLQVGPFSGGIEQPASPLPQEIRDRKARPNRTGGATVTDADTPPRLRECLAAAEDTPANALANARTWRGRANGPARADADQCMGVAYGNLGLWAEAEGAFLSARDTIPAEDRARRGALSAMAGNAALATGASARALALLDLARTDAAAAERDMLVGGIELDRARALVALERTDEAKTALETARTIDPGNADAWLLSATLSRRQGQLAGAQQQIEKAAGLAPLDPETGLEAGVIAMLAGREDAARRSWQSVIATVPQSPQAETARGYLAQLNDPVEPAPKLAKP